MPELFFAIFLPIAFPHTVIEATRALIKNCKLKGSDTALLILSEIRALIAPLKTPQISPITSAQKLATLEEFLIYFTEVLEPEILLLALVIF